MRRPSNARPAPSDGETEPESEVPAPADDNDGWRHGFLGGLLGGGWL